MSDLAAALRAATAAALAGSFACLGTATATADPDIGNPPDIGILVESLSNGYTVENCIPAPLNSGEVAAFSCGQNPNPAGPVEARYALFDNAEDMAGSFEANIEDDVLAICGYTGQAPTTWHLGSSGAPAGQVACGTERDAAEITWTTDGKNVLSHIRGPNADVNALYQWWQTQG